MRETVGNQLSDMHVREAVEDVLALASRANQSLGPQ